NDALSDLEREKLSLKDIENKLDNSQKSVEQREIEQQDLKTSQETSEDKLQELMGSFASISEEATKLEAQLADALKALDNIQSTVEITPDQKATIDELTAALEEAGSLLRDLLMEYQALNERLEMLQTQHDDLEDEYTRLVEQQLGEL
ncbi:MAG: hypothetical protein KDD62_10695, partial [Bdellovibrionales bacterium]|nr:hypothetical protein [Bdellovibrionales bacterium]